MKKIEIKSGKIANSLKVVGLILFFLFIFGVGLYGFVSARTMVPFNFYFLDGDKPIAGCTIQVYAFDDIKDANGRVIHEAGDFIYQNTSDSFGWINCILPSGIYLATEVEVPDGYERCNIFRDIIVSDKYSDTDMTYHHDGEYAKNEGKKVEAIDYNADTDFGFEFKYVNPVEYRQKQWDEQTEHGEPVDGPHDTGREGDIIANLGDVNEDGKIDCIDALQVLKHIVKEDGFVLKGSHLLKADYNQDGVINCIDALRILEQSVVVDDI